MTANTPAQTGMDAGAVSREEVDWDSIDWNAAHQNVCRLQRRIVKATKEKKWGKVKALQRILTRSFSSKALAVRRVTENQGRKTPGVDGEIWTMPSQKARAIQALRQRGYHPKPLRRVYIVRFVPLKRLARTGNRGQAGQWPEQLHVQVGAEA